MNKKLFKTLIIWLDYKLKEKHLNRNLFTLTAVVENESDILLNKFGVTSEDILRELGDVFLLLAEYNYNYSLYNIILVQESL